MSSWPYSGEVDPRDGVAWEAEDDRLEAASRRRPVHGGYPDAVARLSIAEHAAMLRIHEDDDGGVR